jgi:hypothetical protein
MEEALTLTTDARADEPPAAKPRRRPGFSLLALVWLLTVSALGVGLYRAGEEVVPLRESIARLRKELGYFPVDDVTKTHARRVRVKIPTAFQWRLFLTGSQPYALRYFVGAAPDEKMVGRERWFAMLRSGGHALPDALGTGEIGWEALLTEYGGRTWLRTGLLSEEGTTVALPPGHEWLTDETAWVVSSDASYDTVKAFEPGERIVLLHIERSVHADEPENGETSDPAEFEDAAKKTAPVERFVLWLEPPLQPTPAPPPPSSPGD